MEPVVAWIDMIINAIESAILGVVLWHFLYLRRDIMAMLRVLRRIDRKTTEPPGVHFM